MPYVNVYVDEREVLEDLSNELLVKELRKRDVPFAAETDDATADLDKIFYAFYYGKETDAVQLMRKYVQDVTGRTLP